jgi:energy-coupling factor transporter ATP-binding protein EcfA2
MIGVLDNAKNKQGIELDAKQLLAYQMICATFMIKIIQERAGHIGTTSQRDIQQQHRIKNVISALKSMGGKDQLILFLTGPAGAGKTTAIKLAQRFCEKFSEACHIPFDQYSFYFTAYTGAAASDSGGITTLTALQIPLYSDISEPSPHTITTLNKVRVLIIDEISFMTVKQLQKISERLQNLFDCTVPFGGMSVIFSGDFRQLEQGQTPDNQLLYTIQSGMYFENLLNSALILENDHRFKDDPEFGRMLTNMWFDDLSTEQKQELNKRVVMDKSTLPVSMDGDCHYACPTNVHRNIISANNFRRHVLATHR